MQAGLKATRLDRRILLSLSAKHYAFDIELLAVVNLLKLRVVELPMKIRLVACHACERKDGAPSPVGDN